MRGALWCVAVASLAACTPRPADTASGREPADAKPPADGARVVTPYALGGVRIGMTLAELRAATGDTATPYQRVTETCGFMRPAGFPSGVSAMLESDTVVRFDVEVAGVVTPEGAGVGDAEGKVLGLYGARAEVSPHKYTGPEGHYVTVKDAADSTRLTVFETDGRTVVRYRAGRIPPVLYVEGCA